MSITHGPYVACGHLWTLLMISPLDIAHVLVQGMGVYVQDSLTYTPMDHGPWCTFQLDKPQLVANLYAHSIIEFTHISYMCTYMNHMIWYMCTLSFNVHKLQTYVGLKSKLWTPTWHWYPWLHHHDAWWWWTCMMISLDQDKFGFTLGVWYFPLIYRTVPKDEVGKSSVQSAHYLQ